MFHPPISEANDPCICSPIYNSHTDTIRKKTWNIVSCNWMDQSLDRYISKLLVGCFSKQTGTVFEKKVGTEMG
jgi:hypothetical protein